jgi:hypothetical protein
MNSGKRDGFREIHHQRFIKPLSSGVKTQMHSWGSGLSEREISSIFPLPNPEFIKQLFSG